MEERFGKRFKTFAVEGDHNNHTTGVFVDDVDILKDFIRQEISLALQKRNEELVGKDVEVRIYADEIEEVAKAYNFDQKNNKPPALHSIAVQGELLKQP